jgi:N-acetylneuraminic acid mutarotase
MIHQLEYPERRKFHSCILVDDHIYVFGGMYSDLETFKPVENCLWRLNLNEIKWEKLNIKMPVLTYFHAACVNLNGQIFLHGGVKATDDYSSQSRINHLYTIMVKVPKLSEICWTKLIANYPNLLNFNQKKLVDIGLPTCFINRII